MDTQNTSLESQFVSAATHGNIEKLQHMISIFKQNENVFDINYCFKVS